MTGPALNTPGTMGPTPPIVGRAAERVLLAEQLSAVESGRGNVVIIGGEAGIGKTTVARDLVARARAHGFLILVGQSHDLTATPPYGLWLDLGDDYRHASRRPELPPLPQVLSNPNLDSVTSQSAFFADVTSFLRAIAEVQPVVIVLEDVHWADPASLELLRHVSAHVSHLPLLLVVTYRIDELTRQHPFYRHLPSIVRESEGLRLDLKRLGESELDALVSLHYPLDDESRQRLVAYLARYAEGNPFFAMELLRALQESEDGGLTRDGDGWTLTAIDRLRVPQLVRQVIDSRVARLGEATRMPLTIAAVIGHEFSVDLLASISVMPPDDLYAVIDGAIDGHLVTGTHDGTGIQFVHALTREALYESMPIHRRRDLHRRVAEQLERQPAADPDAIAYHYRQAGDPRAPDWLARAGDRAQRTYAWLTARERFAAAAALLEDVPGEELTRARLLYRCGRLERYSSAATAIESLRAAARLAELAGDPVLAADATYSQGLVQLFADVWDTGLTNMIRGIEALMSLPAKTTYIPWTTASWMADALPTIAMRAAAEENAPGGSLVSLGANRHMSLAWFLAHAGRAGEALEIAETYRHIVLDRSIGPLAIANTGHAAFGRGIAQATLGSPDLAGNAFDDARNAYLLIDHHACIAFTHLTRLNDLVIPYRTGDVAVRRRLAGEAEIAIEQARGALPSDVSPALARLTVLYLDGRWDEASAIAAACDNFGTYILRRQVTLAIPHIARHRGVPAEAWDHINRLLPGGPDTEPGSAVLFDAVMLQQLAAHLHLDTGDLDAARRWLEANDRWLDWSGSVPGRAGNAMAWARLAASGGDVAGARALATRAVREASEPRQPLALIQASRLLGELAHRAGDSTEADEHLTASLALATACEIPFERAASMASLAELKLVTEPDDAVALADASLVIARDLRAQPLVERNERLLAARSATLPAAVNPAGLTSRELDVLRLVARGLTDAEVADQLSISPRTVGQHLRSVYNKLDVRSRTEATRFAIEHDVV